MEDISSGTDTTPDAGQSTRSSGVDISGNANVNVGRDLVGGDAISNVHVESGGSFIGKLTNIFADEDETRTRRNKLILLDKVRTFWVMGVLEKSVYHAVAIELDKKELPEAVEHPWDRVLQSQNESRLIPTGKKIIEIFDEMDRALLILGLPGAGKTITLLELARDAIARAERDAKHALPVVFNLSSWTPHKKISDWLTDELSAKYRIPKRIGRVWVEQDDLLVLLDGLDEVRRTYREACVRAVNFFRQEHGVTGIVLCSRVAEYSALDEHLNFGGAILIQPLTSAQINLYLDKTGLVNLSAALPQDPVLSELAQSPLMLNVMSIAYHDLLQEDLKIDIANSIEIRRKQLFDLYVASMFKRKGLNKFYTPAQTREWLSWLAKRMRQHTQFIFFMEQLQPSWLANLRQRQTYFLSSRMIAGLFAGLIFGVFVGLINGPEFGPTSWLRYGLIFVLLDGLGGLIGGLIDARRFNRSENEMKVNNSPALRQAARNVLIYGLAIGLVTGVIGGLINGPFFGLFVGLLLGLIFGLILGLRSIGRSVASDIRPAEALTWSWSGIPKACVFGLVVGLFFGLMSEVLIYVSTRLQVAPIEWLIFALLFVLTGGLIGVIGGGLRSGIVEDKTVPNQGIKLSIRNMVLGGLLFGLTSGLIFALISGIVGGLASGLIGELLFSGVRVGLTIGIGLAGWYGGFDVVQHYTLRFMLYLSRQFPWRIAHFLDYAASLVILQKVGGGYIFVHRLMLEHFAAMEK